MTTKRKIFNLGRRMKLMLSGGLSKKGKVFGYAGVKDKSGFYGGTSIGTKGYQGYRGYSKGKTKARLIKNFTTGQIKPKLKIR